MSQLEAIGRLISLALRSGVDVKSIIEQIRGIRCPSPTWAEGGKILSCSDAIARVIEQRIADHTIRGTKTKAPEASPSKEIRKVAVKVPSRMSNMVGICPDCGDGLQHVEGCMVCRGCGYSKCG